MKKRIRIGPSFKWWPGTESNQRHAKSTGSVPHAMGVGVAVRALRTPVLVIAGDLVKNDDEPSRGAESSGHSVIEAQRGRHPEKHTFWRPRAGAAFEDHQNLSGHRSARITTRYSAAELSRLIEAADSVRGRHGSKPELVDCEG